MAAIALTRNSHKFYGRLWAQLVQTDGRSCDTHIDDIIETAYEIYEGEADLIFWIENVWLPGLRAAGLII